MKRSRAEGAMPPSKAPAEASGKAQRRQKASTPRLATAVASLENAAAMGGGDDKNAAAAAAAAADIRQSSFIPSAQAEEEAVGWGDGAAELGERWCLWGVEEEKLSGWFPFVDEDFLCSDSGGGEGWWGGLLWEEADHDIWQLQHIHEIPHTAAK